MLGGNRIKECRTKLGYSQENLGKLINISKVSICGYENGTRFPTIDKFEALVDVLGVTPDYLLGRDIDVVAENSDYSMKMSKEEVSIITSLRSKPELYNKIVKDPKRMVELISIKIK